MKPKNLYTIIYVIIGVLFASLLITFNISKVNENIDFFNTISGLSSFMVAILTALYVFTTTKQIEIANNQLIEMKTERAIQEQPLILVENKNLLMEVPRFYYSPPFDEYSFQSRYIFVADLVNKSNYAAITVDISAELCVPDKSKGKGYYKLGAASQRINIMESNSSTYKIHIMFTGDDELKLFESLRSLHTDELPIIEVSIIYKNLSGGYFKTVMRSYLTPKTDDEKHIKEWHTLITGAPINYKEQLEVMKMLSPNSSKWDKVFDAVKEEFKNKISYNEDIEIDCIEIFEDFDISLIDKEEYEKECSTHAYGKYIHKAGNCNKND